MTGIMWIAWIALVMLNAWTLYRVHQCWRQAVKITALILEAQALIEKIEASVDKFQIRVDAIPDMILARLDKELPE